MPIRILMGFLNFVSYRAGSRVFIIWTVSEIMPTLLWRAHQLADHAIACHCIDVLRVDGGWRAHDSKTFQQANIFFCDIFKLLGDHLLACDLSPKADCKRKSDSPNVLIIFSRYG